MLILTTFFNFNSPFLQLIRQLTLVSAAIIAPLALLFTSALPANAATVSGELKKWHPVIIDFVGPSALESDNEPNPFLDYRLQVTLEGPSGQVYLVPGFFDGDGNGNGSGNIFRVRFSPDEGGQWHYTASFRSGNDVAIDLNPSAGSATSFNGETGTFTVSNLDDNAPGFLSQGRLVHVGEHYLKFVDGDYWIKGGTDSPENFMGYRGFDNTIDQGGIVSNFTHEYTNHVSDWNDGDPNFVSADTGYDGKAIIGSLNYLAAKNVNSIYFLPMNLGGDGQETYPFISAANNNSSKTHYDISKLTQWNTVFNHAQRKGIALHFVLNETEGPNENWLDNGSLGQERKLFYRELIARFGYVLAGKWNLSEENDFSVANLRAFTDYIRALDWSEKPVSVHTKPNNFRDYDQIVGEQRFEATSIQYNPDQAGQHVENWRANSANAGHKWVIDMDENNPAGSGLTDSNTNELRQKVLYDVYFSGGNIEWYGGYHALPLGGDMRMEDFQTREAMWEDMYHARQFMEDYLPFYEMEPADNLLSGEDGKYGGGEVFRKANAIYAIYLPDANPSGTLNLSEASGEFEKRWFNPRTGVFSGSSSTLTASNSVALGAAPSDTNNDWVVLLARVGDAPPPPVSDGVYSETGGLVVMETENTLSALDKWIIETNVNGFTGTSHIEFTGNGSNGGPPTSPLEYEFTINQPGDYRLFIRAHKQLDGQPGDKNNDGYVRMEGDFTSGNNAPLSLLTNDTKFFGGSANGWGWAEQLDDPNDVKFPAVYTFKAGETYTLTLSGRSIKWNIDRIVLRHSSLSDGEAKNVNNPESPRGEAPPMDDAPTLSLSANPTTVMTSGNSTLTWSTQNANDCLASGAWSGSKNANGGNQVISNIMSDSTFTLSCSNANGSTAESVSVMVDDSTPGDLPLVTSLTLVDADSDQSIADFDPLSNGDVINLADLSTANFNIEANVANNPGSVRFSFDGNNNFATESVAPYAIAGDNAGDFNPWTLSVGTHTITATPYTEANAAGTMGTGVTINFEVVNESSPPPPNTNVPTVDLMAPASTAFDSTITLSWMSTDAESCMASGGWTGSRATSGSEVVGPLTSDSTFTLSCSGVGGDSSVSTTVLVIPANEDSDADGLPDDWEMMHFGNLDQSADDDVDQDGLDNAEEFAANTDPMAADSDGDGVTDGDEIANGSDPNDQNDLPSTSNNEDADSGGGSFASLTLLFLMLLYLFRKRMINGGGVSARV